MLGAVEHPVALLVADSWLLEVPRLFLPGTDSLPTDAHQLTGFGDRDEYLRHLLVGGRIASMPRACEWTWNSCAVGASIVAIRSMSS